MTSLQQRVPTATSSSNSAGNSSNYPSNVGIGAGLGGLLGGQSRFQNKHVANPTGKNSYVQKDGSKITASKGNLYVAQIKNKSVAKSALTFSSVPLPTNTPSLLKENKGKDVSVSLVPGGGAVSGASNVWGATASSTPASATQSTTVKTGGAPVISLSKPAPWAKPAPAPAGPGGSSESHSGDSAAASEGNIVSEVKPQTANWAETVSDEEDNDSEDEGNKKRPRQQYENLDDNAFSYTGSISASEETTLVDHRFSMIASDDSARAASRGPEWTRASYSYGEGNNRTGRFQYEDGSQNRGNPRTAPIGAFNRGFDQSPQHFSYEEGFLNRGGPRAGAMGAGRGAEPPSQQPQGYEWRRQKPSQFEPGSFNSYAQPPPPPHQHQQPYGRHPYNNTGAGNFFPPHAGGSGFPGFDRPGNNAYSFNGRTSNFGYNASLEFNNNAAAGAGGYGAAVLKPAPPQPAPANEERDPIETEELAQQRAIENARRELELLDLTRQQKMQQQQELLQQQQLQLQLQQQQQQEQELQQQQQQQPHRIDEFSQPPPLLHTDFQARNFPLNKQAQFHSGFAPPSAASRSGPHPPFKAHAGENYVPKRGGPASGGYGRGSGGPSDYNAGPQRHFNAVPSKADQEVVWERKKKVEEPKIEATDINTADTASPSTRDSSSATAQASKLEDAPVSTSAAPNSSQEQSAGSSLAQQPTQAVRTEPVAAPARDVKARSYSSLFVQNNESSSAPAPSAASDSGAGQGQGFNLRPAYPGPTNSSSSQPTFSGGNVEGLAGDAYPEISLAQGPKKRFLFDPKSNQMVEPTAIVSSDSKSFQAGSNATTSKGSRQPYVKKGSQESSQPGHAVTNGAPPAARSSMHLNRKEAEDSEGKWLRNPLPPVAATEPSEGSDGQDKADRDADSEHRAQEEGSKPQTSRVPSSVLSRPPNPFLDFAASKRAAFEASVEQATRVIDAKKEAQTLERLQRGPRSKGFLFRYNDAGELEQVLSEEERAKLKSAQEEATVVAEELADEVKHPAAQSSTAVSAPQAAERPQPVIAWQTPHSTLQVVGGADSSKGDKDASTSDEAPAELAVPSLIPPYSSLSGFNVQADSFQPVSFAGLGLPDRPGSSGPSALEGAGMSLNGGSPERSRIIGLNSPMPGLWGQNVPALSAPPPTPQQNPNAELDKSLTRSTSASLGLQDHGGYSSLDSLGGLGGILQNSLLDSADTNRWNQDFHNFPSFNSAGFGGEQEGQIQSSFIDNLTDLVVEASFSPFGGLSSSLHSNKASSAMLSADSQKSFRQDRSGDSAEPQAPIGSGGKRFREPRSGGEEASNFVKATFGRGRGVHRTRLPHPSAERRARRSPEGDVVQVGNGEGESINASKDLEGSDRNEEVSGRGPSGRPGGRSGRGRGRGRSERSEEDRDNPKEYRPPREFKGGRGRGRGEGREARDRDRDAGRGSGGRESRQGRGVFRRSGPPPSEDNSNNDS